MELIFDFRLSAAADAQRCAVGPGTHLLDCYQKALGHELPNQLVALQGLARVLQVDVSDRLDPESCGRLARLADLARTIDEQVRALAQVGRYSRDPGPVTAVPLDEALREAVAEVAWQAPGLSVHYAWEGETPVVRVPRRSLHQVLVQLLRQATRGSAPRVVLGVRAVEAGAEVWCSDDAPAMSQTRLEQLFDPFAGGTTDFGWFLTRELVAGWRGSLALQSQPEVGTKVIVFIPAAEPAQPAIESADRSRRHGG